MKRILTTIIAIVVIYSNSGCQSIQKNGLVKEENKSTIYAGTFKYGESPEKGPTGQITFYPESKDNLLFYIDISNGAPSYNMGTLYDRIAISNNKGIFVKKFVHCIGLCKWSIEFTSDSTLTIKTLDNNYDCGFGGNVWADGNYKKLKKGIIDYFIDMHGHKYFFDKTKPEDYYKIPR